MTSLVVTVLPAPPESPHGELSPEWRQYIRDFASKLAPGEELLAARAAFMEPFPPLGEELRRMEVTQSKHRPDLTVLEAECLRWGLPATRCPLTFLHAVLRSETARHAFIAEHEALDRACRMRDAWTAMSEIAHQHGFDLVHVVKEESGGRKMLRHDLRQLRARP